MQEHNYTAKKSRIIKQSFFIWLFVAIHILTNIITAPTLIQKNQTWAILFINGLLNLITIPSILLFIKYYRYSVGKKFIVTYNSLKFIDEKTGETTELNNNDIEKIYLIENKPMSKLPWLFHGYFVFIDNKKNKIIVTSYFMDISDFWLDTLTRKVSRDILIREERAYPIM